MNKEKSGNQRKTTTIQVSLKTKALLDKVKETEQVSSYDTALRIILLHFSFNGTSNH
ncbi:hypothetical protein LCGC14_1054210 [marine sediment metagenome]|uniref:Uncharacterized protein n=1 Tax=marine sediment metagenome TaxID=412755 RepID=A0A0F9MSG9_9ZZZZ